MKNRKELIPKKIPIYHVDAFTSRVFSGNPAVVCLLDAWLEDTVLQSIARANNLSETAFFVPGRVEIGGWATVFMEGVVNI